MIDPASALAFLALSLVIIIVVVVGLTNAKTVVFFVAALVALGLGKGLSAGL